MIWWLGGSGDVAVALYSDVSGAPGAILAQSASVPTTSGWQEIPITGASIVAGTSYYLAEEFSSSADTWYYIATPNAWYYPYTTFGTFPTSVTWVSNTNIIETSMTYTTGATPVDWGAVPVTNAAVVATTGQTITGPIDATGCDVGVYVGPAVSGVTVTAKVSNAHYVGIYVDGGNANVTGSTVSNVGDNPFDGMQYGWGIAYVNNGSNGATGKVTNTRVSSYQKAGIVVLGQDTNVTLSGDTVTGNGPVPYIAQNGVEFDSGANGSITNSQVSGDSCTLPGTCGEDYFATTQSVGILLDDAASGVVVSNNKVSSSDIGVWAGYDSQYGSSEPESVSNNTLQNNYGYGLLFDSVNGTSTNNYFQNNPVGLLVTDYSANSYVTSINDQFMNNKVNNEALQMPGSSFNENLVVETSAWPMHFPFPGPHGPHGPHFPKW